MAEGKKENQSVCSHKAVRISRPVRLCREVRLRWELEQLRRMTEPQVLLLFFTNSCTLYTLYMYSHHTTIEQNMIQMFLLGP